MNSKLFIDMIQSETHVYIDNGNLSDIFRLCNKSHNIVSLRNKTARTNESIVITYSCYHTVDLCI